MMGSLLTCLAVAMLTMTIISTSFANKQFAIVPKMRAAEAFYGLTRDGCDDRLANDPYAILHNISCRYTGSFQPDIQENIRILNDLIDDDTVVGIAVSVLDSDLYAPVIDRCMAQGKPIITFDSDAPESDRLAYVGTDNYAMGTELAKLLKQIKPDGGTYGIVSGFGFNLEERVRGVRDGLQEDKVWMEVQDSPKNGLEDTAISLEKMWELVGENENLGAVVSVVGLPMFNPNTTDWKHFVDSNRDVLTIIADTLPVQLDLMQKSYVDALVGQLPYNMGYQGADVLLEAYQAIVDQGAALDAILSTDTIPITHQLEVLRIPLTLPFLEFNYNFLGKTAIVGYILCSLIMGASVGLMYWTWKNQKHIVVVSSQPVFLMIICFGTLLMGSAIIPLSIDDETSEQAADIACMSSPWLIFTGFTIAFAALFSKTWRLNKIFLSENPLRRIKVTEKDVMLPFAILLSINVITLICWTAIAPLKFIRTLDAGTDPWNRPLGSFGQCRSESPGGSIPYLVIIGLATVTALIIANLQAYRSRNIRTEFNESLYIAMANASFLQAILICLPIIFLSRENPQAYFIVLSVVLFILSGAILLCMFVPKIITLRNFDANRIARSNTSIHVSGLAIPSSLDAIVHTAAATAANKSSSEQVDKLLQQCQGLSWEDRIKLLNKLGVSEKGTDSEQVEARSDPSAVASASDTTKANRNPQSSSNSQSVTDRTSATDV